MTTKQMQRTLSGLSMAQRGVYHVLKHYGPMHDEMLVAIYPHAVRLLDRGHRYPAQTPSGLRTRRSELVKRGAVIAKDVLRDQPGPSPRVWIAL